jgi:hypothetical protein
MPHWLGKDLFHSSHRANLLRKDSGFYSKFNWNENSENPFCENPSFFHNEMCTNLEIGTCTHTMKWQRT